MVIDYICCMATFLGSINSKKFTSLAQIEKDPRVKHIYYMGSDYYKRKYNVWLNKGIIESRYGESILTNLTKEEILYEFNNTIIGEESEIRKNAPKSSWWLRK